MKYLTYDERYWACDIEADDFLDKATRIWCVCVENIKTGEKHAFTTGEDFRSWIADTTILVGHNFIGYDLPMLNRHWSMRLPVTRVVDTFVLSQLYNPTLTGGHSLKAWGQRVKHEKTNHNDFTKLTPEMLDYCANDTSLTAILYRKLSRRMADVGFTELGVEIEHNAWNIIQNKQRKHGFPFDEHRASCLLAELETRKRKLENEILQLYPPQLVAVGEYRKAFKGNGGYSKQYERHVQQYPRTEILEGGAYRVFDYVSFNIGSSQQRVEKLLALGWQPTQLTPAGNPKTDEESVSAFAEATGKPELKAIAKWIVVNSRIVHNLRPWLNAYNEKTGAIHGQLFIASTLRYRHSNPNTANIPAVRLDKEKRIQYGEAGAWSYECRDLFHCGDRHKYSLVGVDAKGIQIRILLNYAFSQAAYELYTAGDPHVDNAKLLGLKNKAAAKKFFYTLIMGGGGARLAADQVQFGTHLTARQASVMKAQMIATIPGFKELIQKLQDELHETGRIKLCDGTPIIVPSDHMVIPYLLQGDESRIMKLAGNWLDKEIRRERLDAHKVGDIHDEWQFVVSNEHVSRFMEVALAIFPKVGKFFNYRVPIEGDAKVGKTWAETH